MNKPEPAMLANRWVAFIIAVALPAVLAGCFGKAGAENMICPSGNAVAALDVAAQFGPGSGRTRNDVTAAARIMAVKTTCGEEKNGIRVDVDVSFTAVRRSPELHTARFTYLVAVVDRASNILNEERFILPVRFVGSESLYTANEKITLHLPVAHLSEGGSYAVLAGFQLTPDQLRFNKERRQSAQ